MFLMREDDKLILRGVAADFQRLQGWVGVVFVLLGLWATGGSWYASQLAFLVLSVPLIVFGGFLLSRHRTVTTIFDLPSRRVIFTITTSVGWGWYQRSYTYSYSFDEIAGTRAARRRFRPPFFSTAKLHRVMELRAALAFYRR